MPVSVFTVRGTAEPFNGPNNLLTYVTRELDPVRNTGFSEICYQASVGAVNAEGSVVGVSEDESIRTGVVAIAAAVRATPNPAGLLGYSLGAAVVSRFLELQAQGEYADCELAWVGFVANPCRAPGDSIDTDPNGFGINGAHGPWPDGLVTWEAANPLDAITSCPADSPLRFLSDATSNFTFANLSWSMDLARRFIDGDWQHTSWTPEQLANAAGLMYGYLLGGSHNTAYIEDGYCSRLGARINAATADMA